MILCAALPTLKMTTDEIRTQAEAGIIALAERALCALDAACGMDPPGAGGIDEAQPEAGRLPPRGVHTAARRAGLRCRAPAAARRRSRTWRLHPRPRRRRPNHPGQARAGAGQEQARRLCAA